MPAVVEAPEARYRPIPLAGLVQDHPLDFPLYLDPGDRGLPVLYRGERTALGVEHVARLVAEGVTTLLIRTEDGGRYHRRVESAIHALVRDAAVSLESRAEILVGVCETVATDLLARLPGRATLDRARKVLGTTSALVLREPTAMNAVRRALTTRTDLAGHSLTVSMLCIGLARLVLGADPTSLTHAGLAGLLHDVGRVDHAALSEDEDPEHAARGAAHLASQGLPAEVCAAVRDHHERYDGSGYPSGRARSELSIMAQVVGIADTFDNLYVAQQPKVGLFDCLSVMARVYRGCFDQRLVVGFVRLFADLPAGRGPQGLVP
jgi:putative nucleotidyltransferase with HDIG domain